MNQATPWIDTKWEPLNRLVKIDWQWHIKGQLRNHWHEFTEAQRKLLYLNAASCASDAMADHYKHG